MNEISTTNIKFTIDTDTFKTLTFAKLSAARNMLAKVWDEDAENLNHFLAIFYDKEIQDLSNKDSFVTLSFADHGYIEETNEKIDTDKIKKQFEIDLEIINREAQWSKEESIFFGDWWPKPHYDDKKKTLEFGISLVDSNKRIINKTLNRIILTRFGHIEINYSLSEELVLTNKELSYFQAKLDEVCSVLAVEKGYKYDDINEDIDSISKAKIINLILSAEIF